MAINVKLWDAIEEHMGGTPVVLPPAKNRSQTMFNTARREQKVASMKHHIQRNKNDAQSVSHLAKMEARLAAH